MTFFVYQGEQKKKVTAAKLYWIYCSCYSNNMHTSVRLSVQAIAYSGHRQMSIVYPDKQYLGVSGRVPRWGCDKSIMR